jgi:hypothetical protein
MLPPPAFSNTTGRSSVPRTMNAPLTMIAGAVTYAACTRVPTSTVRSSKVTPVLTTYGLPAAVHVVCPVPDSTIVSAEAPAAGTSAATRTAEERNPPDRIAHEKT